MIMLTALAEGTETSLTLSRLILLMLTVYQIRHPQPQTLHRQEEQLQ